MKTVKTKTIEIPRWEAFLFISLFYGDGGDGYTDDEIRRADEFIAENRLKNLLTARRTSNDQVECTFLIEDENENISHSILVLLNDEAIKNYHTYNLLPLEALGTDDNKHLFKSFDSPSSRKCYIEGFVDGKNTQQAVIVDHLEGMVDSWWESCNSDLKGIFATMPYSESSTMKQSFQDFWKRVGLSIKVDIYNYCIIKANDIQVDDSYIHATLMELVCYLSDLFLEIIHTIPMDEMTDKEEGILHEKYQDDFNRFYDEIENRILNYTF